jgi:hypothetical protein
MNAAVLTQVPTTPTPDVLTQYRTLMQAVIDAATEESNAPGATATQKTAAQRLISQLEALIGQLDDSPQPPAPYVVSAGDLSAGGIFGIAWRILGDPLQFTAIMDLNNLVGIKLSAGQQLLMPAIPTAPNAATTP